MTTTTNKQTNISKYSQIIRRSSFSTFDMGLRGATRRHTSKVSVHSMFATFDSILSAFPKYVYDCGNRNVSNQVLHPWARLGRGRVHPLPDRGQRQPEQTDSHRHQPRVLRQQVDHDGVQVRAFKVKLFLRHFVKSTLISACRSTINKRQRLIVVLPPNTVTLDIVLLI